ncbi:MAG: Rdx family protein [Desulfobulbaceae bacterium]|nr:Rdx family protein [Desulfobulbaceae bacterium]
MPRASSLGDRLQAEFGARAELISGSGGIFVVAVDGRELFSKAKAGRFPEPDEIVAMIKELSA